jgi:hypothetical protein
MSDTCAKLHPCQFLFKGGGVCFIEITSPPSWDAGFSTGAGQNVRSTGLSGGGVKLRGVPQSAPTRLFTLADSELGEIKIRPEKFLNFLYIIFSGGSLKASQGMHGAATLNCDSLIRLAMTCIHCWIVGGVHHYPKELSEIN